MLMCVTSSAMRAVFLFSVLLDVGEIRLSIKSVNNRSFINCLQIIRSMCARAYAHNNKTWNDDHSHHSEEEEEKEGDDENQRRFNRQQPATNIVNNSGWHGILPISTEFYWRITFNQNSRDIEIWNQTKQNRKTRVWLSVKKSTREIECIRREEKNVGAQTMRHHLDSISRVSFNCCEKKNIYLPLFSMDCVFEVCIANNTQLNF